MLFGNNQHIKAKVSTELGHTSRIPHDSLLAPSSNHKLKHPIWLWLVSRPPQNKISWWCRLLNCQWRLLKLTVKGSMDNLDPAPGLLEVTLLIEIAKRSWLPAAGSAVAKNSRSLETALHQQEWFLLNSSKHRTNITKLGDKQDSTLDKCVMLSESSSCRQ